MVSKQLRRRRLIPLIRVSMLVWFVLLSVTLANGFFASSSRRLGNDINKKCILLRRLFQSSPFSDDNFYDNHYDDVDDYSGSDDDSSKTTNTTRLSSSRRRPIRPVRPSSISSKTQQELSQKKQQQQEAYLEALKDPTLLTNIQFADRDDISPSIKRALIQDMGLHSMTEIQSKSFGAVRSGTSVIGRARTGTGKTLAFLLPILERLIASVKAKNCDEFLDLYKPGQTIGVIILVPTRELAIQIKDQAEILLSFHNHNNNKENIDVACIYGGTKIQRDLRLLSGPRLPSILIATPGRLVEHLENSRISRRGKFKDIIQETKIVVLDEADRLLDGFPVEMKRIISSLPRSEKRQTLLFSATIPKKLRTILKLSKTMNMNDIDSFEEIDCVTTTTTNDNNSNKNAILQKETNSRVEQSYLMLENMSQYIPMLVAILRRAMSQNTTNYKILVFFPASKLVRFFVHFFNDGLEDKNNENDNIPVVLEIHSRMSQASRNRASTIFRMAKQGILFTSDVSARGIDYPDVTHVVQYGAPSKDDEYIHRLGRTGRAGRQGKGLLVLLPFESQHMRNIKRRNIQMEVHAPTLIELCKSRDMEVILEPARRKIRSGHVLLTSSAEAAFKAFLAYYVANSGESDPNKVLAYANEFALNTGLSTLPEIQSKLATRLGL